MYSTNATLERQRFNLHLNMDFGGVELNRLSSLRQITAVMWDRYDCFMGLEFVYDDSTRILYGRKNYLHNLKETTGIEVPFLINGAGGERVSGVRVLHSKDTIWAIQVGLSLPLSCFLLRLNKALFNPVRANCVLHSFVQILETRKQLPLLT
jgi:hypothetical protein